MSKVKFKEPLPFGIIKGSDETGWEVGVDEAGRGCCAFSVCCAAVILDPDKDIPVLIQDSKKLTEEQREEMFNWIIQNAIAYSIKFVPETVIDQINILQATYLGWNMCINELAEQKKLCHIMIDGNRFQWNLKLNQDIAMNVKVDCVVKGDAKYASIAAASILAKVSRDRLVKELAKDYPGYDFENNKGYLTPKHRVGIETLGLCDVHRKSYKI